MTDIMLDDDGNFVSASNGDIKTVSGFEWLLQEIKHEMMTYPGDLFYDSEYGFGLLDFLHRRGTELDRIELEQRIREKLLRKQFIDIESIQVNINDWNMNKVSLGTFFSGYDKNIEMNIEIESNGIHIEVVNT